MCLRERKRRCAASWLICLMLLSDSEDTSLGAQGKGDRRARVDPWHLGNSPTLTKGLAPADESALSCSTLTTSWPLGGRILPTELGYSCSFISTQQIQGSQASVIMSLGIFQVETVKSTSVFKKSQPWGAWVAQSVKHLPSAQVMISGSWD